MGIDPLSYLYGREACVRLVESIMPSFQNKSLLRLQVTWYELFGGPRQYYH
jgi:hypothetical protein